MATKNDITNDSLITKASTDSYRSNWDAIFNKPKVVTEEQDTQEKEEDETNTNQ